jgi:hypothetical protein
LSSSINRAARETDDALAEEVDVPRDISSDIRIVKGDEDGEGRTIAFALAIGSIRQLCHLKTSFRTQNQALSYLHKNRTIFERIARERFERGEVENGVIHLTMV